MYHKQWTTLGQLRDIRGACYATKTESLKLLRGLWFDCPFRIINEEHDFGPFRDRASFTFKISSILMRRRSLLRNRKRSSLVVDPREAVTGPGSNKYSKALILDNVVDDNSKSNVWYVTYLTWTSYEKMNSIWGNWTSKGCFIHERLFSLSHAHIYRLVSYHWIF